MLRASCTTVQRSPEGIQQCRLNRIRLRPPPTGHVRQRTVRHSGKVYECSNSSCRTVATLCVVSTTNSSCRVRTR